jgi:hypothetical protein
MPAPRIDHLLGHHKNYQNDRQDFEDLLRRAASLLNSPDKSLPPSPPQEALVLSTTELMRARSS